MPTIAKTQSTPRTLPQEGTQIARVIGLINIGTIKEEYMGEMKEVQKIRLTFELPEDTHIFKEGEDAKPLVQSQEYTLSMGKKSNLRPIVEGILGTSLTDEEAYNFDVEKLLNMPCLVSIKKGKTKKGVDYTKISSTSKLMKGQTCKEAYNPITKLTYDEWNQELFDKLPQFIREKIESSVEYKNMKGITDDVKPDDIPF